MPFGAVEVCDPRFPAACPGLPGSAVPIRVPTSARDPRPLGAECAGVGTGIRRRLIPSRGIPSPALAVAGASPGATGRRWARWRQDAPAARVHLARFVVGRRGNGRTRQVCDAGHGFTWRNWSPAGATAAGRAKSALRGEGSPGATGRRRARRRQDAPGRGRRVRVHVARTVAGARSGGRMRQAGGSVRVRGGRGRRRGRARWPPRGRRPAAWRTRSTRCCAPSWATGTAPERSAGWSDRRRAGRAPRARAP